MINEIIYEVIKYVQYIKQYKELNKNTNFGKINYDAIAMQCNAIAM
jgi:hypothetical protein